MPNFLFTFAPEKAYKIGTILPNFMQNLGAHSLKFKLYVQLANFLMGRHTLKRGTDDYGHAFEHFVMQEIIAYKGYNDKRDIISYWHTYDKKEVDVVIGDAKVAIEIKSTEHAETKHKKGLKAFGEEHPDCRLILVSLDPITRKSGNTELIYVLDFLKMLWSGELF